MRILVLALCCVIPATLSASAPSDVSAPGALGAQMPQLLDDYAEDVAKAPAEVMQLSLSDTSLRPGQSLRVIAMASRPTRVVAMLVRPGTEKALRASVAQATASQGAAVARLRIVIPKATAPGRYRLRVSTADGAGQSAFITVRR